MELDALIVGAGFAGLHMLRKLRGHGLKVQVHEEGSDMGGVWYWNCYPGARVDIAYFNYQFSDPEIYKDFEFKEKFPDRDEIIRYFHHVDTIYNLSKDICFNTKVKSAEFHSERNQWLVKSVSTNNNAPDMLTWCRHLVLCTGFAAKRYTPPFKGLETFKGEVYHSSMWPQNRQVNYSGKRVAVIGTGASGVQIIQEIGPQVGHLTVYQRTPNLALPLQCTLPNTNLPTKDELANNFSDIRRTYFGVSTDFIQDKKTLDATVAERAALYEKLYAEGGLSLLVGVYIDVLFDQEANNTVYEFWAEKTRSRIHDLVKKDILAPLDPPHAFGIKRTSGEMDYYEVFNQSNVDIIDVKASPIIEVTETGVRTEKEGVVELDLLILATGFDSITGGILNIDIKNEEGNTLQDKWKNETWTCLGLATAGFPNMYFLYGPQAPTAFSNGVVCVEIQGDWITKLIVKMKEDAKLRVEPEAASELTWKNMINGFWYASLFPGADSWYQGANIPGKPREVLNFAGGIPAYIKALEDCEKNDYAGLRLS